jgi:hypothetical protein
VAECRAEEAGFVSQGSGEIFRDYVDCCILESFPPATCSAEGYGEVGFEDCDDSGNCAIGQPFDPPVTDPPPAYSFDGGRPSFPEDDCGAVCEHLFNACGAAFYDPGCVGTCIAVRDRAIASGATATFETFSECCLSRTISADLCTQTGAGSLGFGECAADGTCEPLPALL